MTNTGKQRLTILGATGSIGLNTLDVVARHPERFEVFALTGNSRVVELAELCRRYQPRYAVVADVAAATRLREALKTHDTRCTVLSGEEALAAVAAHEDVDVVMAAIVGAAGLQPTLAAARAGKRVLLANKEALVMAGPLFMTEVRKAGATLLPIDSEHNAVFQSLPANFNGDLDARGIRRILLTASGGPFRDLPLSAFARVTPQQACAHPNWVMGQKISVDSASMMNKGLEVIEAHWLFNAPAERIDVVVHPQSVIHSLVEYNDGSVLAQLGNPDMRTPIAHALAYPERIEAGVAPLDLFQIGRLDFTPPDHQRFPCLGLAYDALRAGGSAPALLNAANEVAVAAFLAGRLPFTDIARIIARVLERIPASALPDLQAVLQADAAARQLANALIANAP
ncbi:MAG: 1-deoxy-D-xylulose-5-phosphate reductoisomerase [Sterolibacterium sp.]|nr:1-deoxy-D-xylulose-5-phosphate reductoisomerase [Sterolibacterium sp.]